MSEQHFNALPAGYQLQEYTVKSVLGHGGFGITYLAGDNNLGKDVAIKEYLPAEFAVRHSDSRVQPRSTADNDDYEWGLDRFMKEAQTLGLFRHTNIVPVYRAFKGNGTAYMVMEYQRGQPLSDLFRKHRDEFTEEDLLNLILPMLDGLGVVHKAGYLHRDLKPGNIFIREDGSPVLLDFGAARNAVGRKSKNLTSIVTPGYAPLEQYFADGNQGPWTDIYAMASILYQAVAGRIPPEAPARVKRDPITPAVEAGRGRFSETFLAAIDTALAVEEEHRPQNVEQWRAMLLGQEVPEAAPAREAASVRASNTILAGHAQAPGKAPASMAGSASMRFPTIGREDAMAHTRRGGGAGRIAALVIGGVVLLAASGVGAYIALNPDHGLFGTASNNRGSNTSQTSSDADKRRAEEEARRRTDEEAKRRAEEDKRRAEEDQRRADEEKRRADEEKRKAEAEAKRKADEAKRRAEEDAKRREEEAKRPSTDEERRRAEEERRKEEAKRAEEEKRKEEARRAEEDARRRDEEARRREDEKRRAEEQKRREQEEARRREEEEKEKEKRKAATLVSCDYSVLKSVFADETDCYYLQHTMKFTLDQARVGGPANTWRNSRSGAFGTIRIIATVPSSDGSPCRRFQETATINGRTHTGTGTACFRNSAWQVVG